MSIELQLPEHADETEVTIIGETIVFCRLGLDHGENPLTSSEGLGHIWSFLRKHRNQVRGQSHADELLADPDVVPLGYFEHGNSLWFPRNERPLGTEGDFRWDGVHFAGVWVPDKATREAYDEKVHGDRKTWMVVQARGACGIYTAWCNGEVYYAQIVAHKLRRSSNGTSLDELRDYRNETPLFEESCGGFYGDEAKEFFTEMLPSLEKVIA